MAGLSLLIGVDLCPVSVSSLYLYQALRGYNLPAMPEMVPGPSVDALLAVVALAGLAPICEEVLFRGLIQSAYAHRRTIRAILFVGLLFVAFHLSLLQGLSIIPLALALGFVYWRSGSLPAAVLTHFGANASVVLVLTSGVWIQGAETAILSVPATIGGLLLALLGLELLVRQTRRVPAPAAPVGQCGGWARTWPVVVALPLCLMLFGTQIAVGGSPELLAQPVALNRLPWADAQIWKYEIYNIADDPIGDAACTLTPEADAVTLVCQQDQEGYEVHLERRFWSSIPFVGERIVRWDGESFVPLVDLSDHELRSLEWTLDEGAIIVEVTYPGAETERWVEPLPALTGETLITASGVWPWQLNALTFEAGAPGHARQRPGARDHAGHHLGCRAGGDAYGCVGGLACRDGGSGGGLVHHHRAAHLAAPFQRYGGLELDAVNESIEALP